MKARHLFGPAVIAASVLTGCAAPQTATPEIIPQASSVQYVPIDNTPADIAWCVAHPGGSPEWQTASDGTRVLVCRIVP